MDTPVSASQRRIETLSVLDVLASGSSPSQDYTIFLNDGSTKHWAVRRSHQELFRFCQHLNESYISNEIPRPSESFDLENTKAFLKNFPEQHQTILRDFLEIRESVSDYEIPDPAKVLKSGQLQIFQGPRVHVVLTQLRLFVFPQSALESSILPKEAPIHDIIVSKSAALLQEKVKVVIKGVLNDIIFLAASESEAKAWLASFTNTCFAPAWFAKIGVPEREGIEAVKKLLKNENAQFIHRLSDMDILRFLREKGFDVEKTHSAIHYDQLWRKQFRSDYLTAANVYTHLKTSKFIFPGTFDKQSRPIIVFKAGRHDPNTEFMETLKLAIYAFEIAYRTLLYSNEVIVVEDLDGFDRDKNADNRMVKLLLEIVQAHFPERIGRFFAVNAPWYYKLLFKVVKPWLSSELAGKVSIATDPFDTLKQYVAPDQLIKDLGGSCVFDFNDWILQRCFEERVSPRLLENPPVHNIESDLLDCISDISVAKAKTNGLFEGWMKKQGGFVKNFNKRYCVLTPKILYYYKEENDPKAEGFMDLKGASVQKTGSDTFQVVTSSNKIGIFSCSSKHIAGWVTAIQQAISNIPLTLDPFDDYYDQDQDFYNPSFDKEIAPTPSVFPAVYAGRSEAFQIQPARAADEHEASDLEKKIGDVVWTARNGPGALAFADVYVDSKLCRSSFTGESLVAWMQKNSFASTSAQAADLCAQMINNESLRTFVPAGPGFNPAALYYFQEDVPTCFLNNFSWSRPVRSPQIVAASLAKRLAECVAKHTINGEIHQKWLANSRDFRDFKVATGELQRVNLGTLSPAQQTLFFLNIYNLLSLHAQIAFGTPTKYQARNFLISMSYNIGGRDFTLDDILHGILLGNSRAIPVNPSRGEYSLVPVFGPGDDRAQFATRSLTNSQSVSIILGTNPQLWSTQPSNVFYDVEANFDEVLKGITEAYLTKGITIDEANQKVLLPRAIQILRQRLCPVGGPKELFVQLQEACKPSTSPSLDRFTAASPLFSVAFVPSPSRL